MLFQLSLHISLHIISYFGQILQNIKLKMRNIFIDHALHTLALTIFFNFRRVLRPVPEDFYLLFPLNYLLQIIKKVIRRRNNDKR